MAGRNISLDYLGRVAKLRSQSEFELARNENGGFRIDREFSALRSNDKTEGTRQPWKGKPAFRLPPHQPLNQQDHTRSQLRNDSLSARSLESWDTTKSIAKRRLSLGPHFNW